MCKYHDHLAARIVLSHIRVVEQVFQCILRRWNEYFSKICNEEFPHPPTTDPTPGPVPSITASEVSKAINEMKNGKVAGFGKRDDILSALAEKAKS